MTELNAATTRLHEAIGRLENVLAAERQAAAETAAALAAAEEKLARNAEELSVMAAAVATAETTVEADREAASAAAAVAQQEMAALRTQLVETPAAPEVDESEVEELKATIAELRAGLEDAERARNKAIADGETAAAERDEAVAKTADLEEARHDDAKLRAEAADALDAAIGELKTLSGDRANG